MQFLKLKILFLLTYIHIFYYRFFDDCNLLLHISRIKNSESLSENNFTFNSLCNVKRILLEVLLCT